MAPFNKDTDYYRVLEIFPDADETAIRAAFRRLALLIHPNKNIGNPDATKEFQILNEAHEVLSDEKRRAEYDGFLARVRYQTNVYAHAAQDRTSISTRLVRRRDILSLSIDPVSHATRLDTALRPGSASSLAILTRKRTPTHVTTTSRTAASTSPRRALLLRKKRLQKTTNSPTCARRPSISRTKSTPRPAASSSSDISRLEIERRKEKFEKMKHQDERETDDEREARMQRQEERNAKLDLYNNQLRIARSTMTITEVWLAGVKGEIAELELHNSFARGPARGWGKAGAWRVEQPRRWWEM